MNKTFFMLVLLFSTVFTGIQAQKIAYINSNTLMADVPEIKSADSNLQAFQSQLQKKGEQMVAVLQGKYQDLAKRQQSGDISPKDLETQSAALKAEEQKIADFEQEKTT